MRAIPILFLSLVILASNSIYAQQAANVTEKPVAPADAAEFDRLRNEGNDALYNMDYQTARDRYQRMTKIAPEHPAGYVYLANNLWLETLNQSRRLTSSTYTTGSFYSQDKDEDKVDPKRDQEFNALIKQAMAATRARLLKEQRRCGSALLRSVGVGASRRVRDYGQAQLRSRNRRCERFGSNSKEGHQG